MRYFIFCLLFILPTIAHSEVVNYVTPSQQELGTISGSQVQNIIVDGDFFADLDKIAAEHGDEHAMGTFANYCLKKEDYSCAYKWSTIALKGFYWKQIGEEAKIQNIKDIAIRHLSEGQISDLDTIISEFRPK
jgi:hypothetical protein